MQTFFDKGDLVEFRIYIRRNSDGALSDKMLGGSMCSFIGTWKGERTEHPDVLEDTVRINGKTAIPEGLVDFSQGFEQTISKGKYTIFLGGPQIPSQYTLSIYNKNQSK